MIKFYFSGAPNPTKVALFLEEADLAYEPIPVDTRKGQQFAPEFAALNPNNKVPVIVDGDAVVFDSNAILLYLAEKTGKFLPANTPKARGEMLSWLMFVASGVGPYSGSRCTSAITRRRRSPTPPTAICTRPSGITASSTRGCASSATCWATPTPSSTWRCGAGPHGALRGGRRRVDQVPQPEAVRRRDQRRPAAQKAST
jgi:hypothetical protein